MNLQETIGSIVAADYRTAVVFSKFRIDFCCKGGRTIEEVCQQKEIEPAVLIEALQKVEETAAIPEENDVQKWSATELAEYIERVHHGYVRETTPILTAYLKKVASVHGDRHPELKEIFMVFGESSVDLLNHMIKEESVLFPAIKHMERLIASQKALDKPFFFGKVENPISVMRNEHETEGDRFAQIAALSNNYTPPEDACSTYKVSFAKLKEFEEDLHRHIHLENNILFHMAVEMEKELNNEPEYTACPCSVTHP
jgi:regulator of cell morphogenesis and NO signaling